MLEDTEHWKTKHGARFETSKYLLIHFTKRCQPPTASVTINSVKMEPSEEAKYLGVIFDQKLLFDQHLQYVAKKGTKFALAMTRIAKESWGAPFTHMRQLFTAMVAPRMDYASIIFHSPAKLGSSSPPPKLSKFISAQRIAMNAILGCYRTTSTAAMEIESGLLPSHLRLQSKILRTVTRMLTLPLTHPVNACIQRAIKSKSTTSITNLEYIAKNFPDYVKPVEIIHPFIKPPWWEPPHSIVISDNKKVAKSIHNMTSHNQNDIVLYTDGSGFKGGIAAAVHCEHIEEPAQNYLGKESDINVYAAEVTAIKMAADICMTLVTNETQRCTIYTDSQSSNYHYCETRKAIGTFPSSAPPLTAWSTSKRNIRTLK